jgi:predicted  nucleic acid-binding Zn-ribbon protein
MSRLDVAAARFDAALENLERAGASVRGKGSKGDGKLAKIREERDRLAARVVELEEEARSLEGLTSKMETRIDDAIAEIHAAIGH